MMPVWEAGGDSQPQGGWIDSQQQMVAVYAIVCGAVLFAQLKKTALVYTNHKWEICLLLSVHIYAVKPTLAPAALCF